MGVITIAFDDAYKDTFDNVADFLARLSIKATFAVASGNIGKSQENRRVISEDNIKHLAKSGHEIASHSAGHKNLLELLRVKGEKAVRDEFSLSKDRLKNIAGSLIKSFVFPFIDNNNTKLLRDMAGEYYASSRITSETQFFNTIPIKDPYSITGTALKKDITIDELNSMADAVRKDDNTWLIEVYHLVSPKNTKSAHRDEPYRFFTHIDLFKKHIQHLADSKARILTQGEVIEKFYAKV